MTLLFTNLITLFCIFCIWSLLMLPAHSIVLFLLSLNLGIVFQIILLFFILNYLFPVFWFFFLFLIVRFLLFIMILILSLAAFINLFWFWIFTFTLFSLTYLIIFTWPFVKTIFWLLTLLFIVLLFILFRILRNKRIFDLRNAVLFLILFLWYLFGWIFRALFLSLWRCFILIFISVDCLFLRNFGVLVEIYFEEIFWMLSVVLVWHL